MRTSSRSTTSAWPSRVLAAALAVALGAPPARSFQVESPEAVTPAGVRSPLEILEAGRAAPGTVSPSIVALGEGRYPDALRTLTETDKAMYPWMSDYLTGLIEVSRPLERSESEHFILFTPPGQSFLKDYALPSLEKSAAYVEKAFGHRPAGKVRVEIYPNEKDFSMASTLSEETLERSGAIGICKFHRLMIMSPQALPLGYRWLDALSHEYMHLNINELSDAKCELWLHEGTARYFETAYRADPPKFLTPSQQTSLLDALDKGTLVTFAQMSPSMVYLKDQEQVSLAFAEVSHAVSILVRRFGQKSYVDFLRGMRSATFAQAFQKEFKRTPVAFEAEWRQALAKEPWPRTKGAMSESVRFQGLDESAEIGADAEQQVRLGDRMRSHGEMEAALIEYEKALTAEPDNAVILLKAARTDLALGDKDKAIERLRRATDKNPNYITPHIQLATLVAAPEAIAHLREAIAINPFDPSVHNLLADALTATGQTDEAARERTVFETLTSAQQ